MALEITKHTLNTYVGWCFVFYISCCCITDIAIFQLPQIQISELIFVGAFPFCFIYFDKIRLTNIDVALLAYVIVFMINAIYHQEKSIYLEAFGCIYLVVMSVLLSRFLAYQGNFSTYLPIAIKGLFVVSVLTGIVGLLLHYLNVDHSLGYIYKDFPYLGDVWRLNGYTWNNLLLSCIAFSSFYIIGFNSNVVKVLVFVFIALCISIFTLSKEILIFGGLLSFGLLSRKYVMPKKTFFGIIIFLAIIMIWFTFFVSKPTSQSFEEAKINNSSQIDPNRLFSIAEYDFYGTTYFYMAKASIFMISNTPLVGIGSGKFSTELQDLQSKETYPPNLSVYDTHDFYWGQIAELGILYGIFLILFLLQFIRVLVNSLNLDKSQYIFIALSFSYFIISYLVGGSKHYRHFWVFIGILNYFYLTQTNGLTISDSKK